MRCDEASALLPSAVDPDQPVDFAVRRHVASCASCQAELSHYSHLLAALRRLRTTYIDPDPEVLASTLAALGSCADRNAFAAALAGRKVAYMGIGGAVAAGAAATVVLIARRRGMRLAG